MGGQVWNVIHNIRLQDGLQAAMPKVLADNNLAKEYWKNVETFVLLSMEGTSMSYHIDLW